MGACYRRVKTPVQLLSNPVPQGRWKNDISAELPGEVACSARFDLQLYIIHAEGELQEELMLSQELQSQGSSQLPFAGGIPPLLKRDLSLR